MYLKRTFALLTVTIIVLTSNLSGCIRSTNTNSSPYTGSEKLDETETRVVPNSNSKKPVIGVAFLGFNEFPSIIMKYMVEEAEKRNVELLIYDGKENIQEQISNIKDMIRKRVDVIILNPVEAEGCVKCVQLANEAGIPILGVNAIVNTDKLLTYVGSNDLEAGEIEMKYIAERIQGSGNIVVMDGITNQSSQMQRTQGILNILRGYPRISILEEKSGNWRREGGYALMKEWYEKYGNKISAVVSQNDEMALGAIKYLEENNLLGTIPIVGIDAIPDGLKAVKEGKLDATVFQDAEGQAKLSIDLAIKILNKESVARTYFIPFRLVTKENVDQYIKGR